MDSTPEPTKQELCELAYAVGQLVAEVGDDYDIVANIAIGYRDAQMATGEDGAPSPAYTGSGQIERFVDVAGEPQAGAAQGERRRQRVEHWKWILVELDSLRSAIDNTIASSVGDARADGLYWSEIADALEITKQAVQKRYGSPISVYNEIPTGITANG